MPMVGPLYEPTLEEIEAEKSKIRAENEGRIGEPFLRGIRLRGVSSCERQPSIRQVKGAKN